MIYAGYDITFEFALSMQVTNHVQKMDYKLKEGTITVELFKSGQGNKYDPCVTTSSNLIVNYDVDVIRGAVENRLKSEEMQNLFKAIFGDRSF